MSKFSKLCDEFNRYDCEHNKEDWCLFCRGKKVAKAAKQLEKALKEILEFHFYGTHSGKYRKLLEKINK